MGEKDRHGHSGIYAFRERVTVPRGREDSRGLPLRLGTAYPDQNKGRSPSRYQTGSAHCPVAPAELLCRLTCQADTAVRFTVSASREGPQSEANPEKLAGAGQLQSLAARSAWELPGRWSPAHLPWSRNQPPSLAGLPWARL